MGFESFYGGRQGAPFIIVKHFDGIDIPEESVYARKSYAVNEDKTLYLLDDNNNLIESTPENYMRYAWKITELNGDIVSAINPLNPSDVKQITLSLVYLEGMIQCFSQGGNTTDIVNYGEYIIIDTIKNAQEKDNPINGSVYRRGMDYQNDLGGAEYIGQIVGPSGECPDFSMETINDIKEHTGYVFATKYYNEENQGIVPGKDAEGNFHDEIEYALVNIRDEYGNIQAVWLGFCFPYLVLEFNGVKRSPYDTNGQLLPADYEFAELIDNTHPYYKKWKINIPHGIKGDSLKDIEIYPTLARPNTSMYSDSACTISAGIVGENGEPINILTYNKDNSYIELENGKYIKATGIGPWKWKIRCKHWNYDSTEQGSYTYEDLGIYNNLIKVDISESGEIEIYYTNKETDISEIKCITDVSIDTNGAGDEGDGTQKVSFQFNGKDNDWREVGNPLNYILDSIVVNASQVESTTVASDKQFLHHLLVYYSDPQRRSELGISNSFYSPKLDKKVSGWVDLGDIGQVNVLPVCTSYATSSDIPNDPPEEIMGNEKYTGWLVKVGDVNNAYIYVYNYKLGIWEQAAPFTPDLIPPTRYVTVESNSEELKTNGLYFDKTTVRTMYDSSDNVVNQVKKKTGRENGENTYEIFKIGPELNAIGAQLNSNNHNLEEQLVLGTDETSKSTGTNTRLVKEKVYQGNSLNGDYYILLKDTSTEEFCSFDANTNKLTINLKPNITSGREKLYYHRDSIDGQHVIGTNTNLGILQAEKTVSSNNGIITKKIN